MNLIIGQGIPVVGSFQEIEWNGELRILTVKLDVNGGNNFAPLSSQELLYLPFAEIFQPLEMLISKVAYKSKGRQT